MKGERWRQVVKRGTRLLASDAGRVKGPQGHLLLAAPDRFGRLTVAVGPGGGKSTFMSYRVHALVWEAFRGRPPAGRAIHHRDGDRGNNALGNLLLLRFAEHAQGHAVARWRLDRAGKKAFRSANKGGRRAS